MNQDQQNKLFQTLGRIEGKLECLPDLQEDVDSLKQSRSKAKGWIAAMVISLTAISNFLWDSMKKAIE